MSNMTLQDQLVQAGLAKKPEGVTCSYCHQKAELVHGDAIYPHREDLHHKTFWLCRPCAAYVGTHEASDNRPLGTLANAQLRTARSTVHRLFDPLWKKGSMSRHQAYAWLAKGLGIPTDRCHIGYFDLEQCQRTLELIEEEPPDD